MSAATKAFKAVRNVSVSVPEPLVVVRYVVSKHCPPEHNPPSLPAKA